MDELKRLQKEWNKRKIADAKERKRIHRQNEIKKLKHKIFMSKYKTPIKYARRAKNIIDRGTKYIQSQMASLPSGNTKGRKGKKGKRKGGYSDDNFGMIDMGEMDMGTPNIQMGSPF